MQFASTGNAAPPGILITALVYHYFQPNFIDDNGTYRANDLEALLDLLDNAGPNYGVDDPLELPVEPYNDLFEKMRQGTYHIENYINRMDELREALEEVVDHCEDEYSASKLLIKQFGSDFPMP